MAVADLDLDAIAAREPRGWWAASREDTDPCIPLTKAERDALVAEVRRLRDENTALRALVARFYTQAWEDPLTDDEMALLDPIVNEAVQDRG